MLNRENLKKAIRNTIVGPVVFMAVCSMGADKQVSVIEKERGPIAATANNMEYDTQKGHAHLDGEACIDWGDIRLTADRVTMESNAAGEIHKVQATGKVKITNANGSATGGKAVYDAKQETIILTMKPELAQGDHRMIDGDRVTYDMKHGRFKATNARFVIDPKAVSIGKGKGTE